MGSFDGAECSELVGLYIIDQMVANNLIAKEDGGLYRDDGAIAVKGDGPTLDRLRKNLVGLFKQNGLDIDSDIEISKRINYLDIIMDLTTGHVEPYRKPNDVITYVHAQSNHPPAIIKQIPKTVQDRLSNISSTKEIFEAAVTPYQTALNNAGYKSTLKYEPKPSTGTKKGKRNQRKILYFNPPYNKNVVTNVGKTVLNSIKRHIPPDHELYKILNKNTVKVQLHAEFGENYKIPQF